MKKESAKLTLGKVTISNLNFTEMNLRMGGITGLKCKYSGDPDDGCEKKKKTIIL